MFDRFSYDEQSIPRYVYFAKDDSAKIGLMKSAIEVL